MSSLSGTFLPSIIFQNKEFLNWHGLYHAHVRVECGIYPGFVVGASFIRNRQSNLDFEVSVSISSTNYPMRSIFLGLLPIVCFIHSLHQVFILALHMRTSQWIWLLRVVTHRIVNLLRPTFPLLRVDSHGWGVKLALSDYFARDKASQALLL